MDSNAGAPSAYKSIHSKSIPPVVKSQRAGETKRTFIVLNSYILLFQEFSCSNFQIAVTLYIKHLIIVMIPHLQEWTPRKEEI